MRQTRTTAANILTKFDKFDSQHSQDSPKDLLVKTEAEVEAIKTYYLDNVALFAKLKKRQVLVNRMDQLGERQKDRQRLKKAKGTQLLEEEKDLKKMNKQFKKIEEELLEEMDRFKEETGALFLVGLFADQRDKKEEERVAKAKAKKEKNIHETIYGTANGASNPPSSTFLHLHHVVQDGETYEDRRKEDGDRDREGCQVFCGLNRPKSPHC
jgi:hypothetical protein